MRRSFTTVVTLLFVTVGVVWSQTADLVDTRSLGDRGVAFATGEKGYGTLESGAGIGDFNGDGVSDLFFDGREALGEFGENRSPPLLSLVFGSSTLKGKHVLGSPTVGAINLRGKDINKTLYGSPTVRAAGDLDVDGFADAIFGLAEYHTENDPNTGRVFLLRGAPGLSGDHLVEEIGDEIRGTIFHASDPQYSYLGLDASPIGDFNGDGSPDLAILGDFSSLDLPPQRRSAVFVTFAARDLPTEVDVNDFGTQLPGFLLLCRKNEFGRLITSAGDFNGDGFGDFFLCAQWPSGVGRVYLIYGTRAPAPVIDLRDVEIEDLAQYGIVTWTGPANRQRLDFAAQGQAAGVGDVNGDGFDDVLVAAAYRGVSFFETNPGLSVARLFHGRRDFPAVVSFDDVPAGLSTAIHPFNVDGFVGDGFASRVAGASDVNDDGVPDLLIGAWGASPEGRNGAGEAYLLFGDHDLPSELALSKGFRGQRILGDEWLERMGYFVGSAGDFNADGAADILLGSLGSWSQTESLPGRAHVIFGSGSGPPPFTVIGMEPTSGPLRGGTTIVIRGSGFTRIAEEPRVLFGANPSGNVQVISGSELHAVTPPGDSVWSVGATVVLGAETRAVSGGFEYTPNFPELDFTDLEGHGIALEGEGDASPGASIAFGDVTGDGLDDLVVGSQTFPGWAVTIVRGGPGLPAKLPAFTPSERVSVIKRVLAAGSNPVRVAMLGDVNEDGFNDLGIGDDGGTAYVVFGRASFSQEIFIEDELFERRAVRLEASGDASEVSLARMGDVTGDGIEDFAVALSRAQTFDPEAGAILFLAGRKVWPEDFDLQAPALVHARILGSRAGEMLGEEIASALDVNGDGALDLLAATHGGGGVGRAYLFFGGSRLPGDLDAESYVLSGGGVTIDIDDGFRHSSGLHVASAGDTNADGFDDLLLGVEDGGASSQGVTYLVRGAASLPSSLKLVERPDVPDGIVRIFGRRAMSQSARIAPAGDFNSDGRDDFVIGAQPDLSIQDSPWRLTLILGADDLPGTIDLAHAGGRGIEIQGLRIAQVSLPARESGDLNGDGQPDFAIAGGPGAVDVRPGSVYVIFGSYGGATFRRADANFDGRIEISDAIYALAYLFLGGEAPRCEDAVDADDDGKITLTDAVYTLNHLFGGGAAAPEPYATEGKDPTVDSLDCRGF